MTSKEAAEYLVNLYQQECKIKKSEAINVVLTTLKYILHPIKPPSDVELKYWEDVYSHTVLMVNLEDNLSNNDDQIKKIISVICDEFNITEEQIKSKTRKMIYREPRQIASYFIYKIKTQCTLTEIAAIFGQNHDTVINSIKVVKEHYYCEKEYQKKLENICKKFGDGYQKYLPKEKRP
jgi:hypothetical protein